MKHIYAPWRQAYITKKISNKDCIFCVKAAQDCDDKNFILTRFENCFVMLNLFPYNAGHLLILPYSHKANLEDFNSSERAELIEIAALSNSILKKTLNCSAINVGLNLGSDAGGSIPEHLHIHVVPRYKGDTNFLTAIANTKLIGVNLNDIYAKLKSEFGKAR